MNLDIITLIIMTLDVVKLVIITLVIITLGYYRIFSDFVTGYNTSYNHSGFVSYSVICHTGSFLWVKFIF